MLSQESSDIVAECQEHKSENQYHSYDLGDIKEIVARFPSCYHLIYGKDYMSSVKSRYRQQVQKSRIYRAQI